MPDIRFSCPSCGVTLKLGDQFAGRKIKCPKCGTLCTVQGPTSGAPAPGSAPPAKQAVKAPPAKGSPAPTAHAAPKHAVQPTAKTARPTGNGPIRHKSSTKAAGAATTPGRQSSQKRLLILGAVAGLVIVASLGAWFAFFHKTEQQSNANRSSHMPPVVASRVCAATNCSSA